MFVNSALVSRPSQSLSPRQKKKCLVTGFIICWKGATEHARKAFHSPGGKDGSPQKAIVAKVYYSTPFISVLRMQSGAAHRTPCQDRDWNYNDGGKNNLRFTLLITSISGPNISSDGSPSTACRRRKLRGVTRKPTTARHRKTANLESKSGMRQGRYSVLSNDGLWRTLDEPPRPMQRHERIT